MNFLLLLFATFVALTLVRNTDGHGSLTDPPQRSYMNKAGYDTPPNYDFNALNCGGASVSILSTQILQLFTRFGIYVCFTYFGTEPLNCQYFY